MKAQSTTIDLQVCFQFLKATLLAFLGLGILGAQISQAEQAVGNSNLLSVTDRVKVPNAGGTSSGTTNSSKAFIKVRENMTVPRNVPPLHDQSVAKVQAPSDTICNVSALATHGEEAPRTNGGTLDPLAFFNPTTINSSGSIAFNALVDNSTRNQGVFVADSAGKLTAIAIGCGGYGGGGDTTSDCGDPSPIGGHFGGFFLGSDFTPDINDAGDVLFYCDVNGGSSRRALFLFQAATRQVVKVAAPGDPSPLGGTFATVSPGALNGNGQVVFTASTDSSGFNTSIFMWDNGVVTKVAVLGEAAPGGGTFSFLGGNILGFVDGTSIPVNPLPDINDAGQVAFHASVTGGITQQGLIVRTAGVNGWYVKSGDPTPIGGTYLDFFAPIINNPGQIAFFSDTTTTAGWFAGAPGNWRKVIVFFDPVDGGQAEVLGVSNNPMQAIDDQGNVAFWTNLDGSGETQDRLVLGLTDGSLLIAARRGDPTPIGGTYGSMDAWPSVKGNAGTIDAATPGAAQGALSAHLRFMRCSTTLELTSASSKLGEFEIDLPLTGTPGVECRSGGPSRDYTMIFTFNNELTTVGGIATTCGSVSDFSVDDTDPHRLNVYLSGVTCNQEDVTVSVEVHDDQGNTFFGSATMGLLFGDVNGDGKVDHFDSRQVKSDRGQQTNDANFREDVNVSGAIDSPDVRLVKSKFGTMLPGRP